MKWSFFTFSSAQVAAGAGMRALTTFEQEFVRLGGPVDMGMFSVQDEGEDFETFYLSPAVEQRAPHLLRILNAKHGPRPPESAVVVVAVAGKRPSQY